MMDRSRKRHRKRIDSQHGGSAESLQQRTSILRAALENKKVSAMLALCAGIVAAHFGGLLQGDNVNSVEVDLSTIVDSSVLPVAAQDELELSDVSDISTQMEQPPMRPADTICIGADVHATPYCTTLATIATYSTEMLAREVATSLELHGQKDPTQPPTTTVLFGITEVIGGPVYPLEILTRAPEIFVTNLSLQFPMDVIVKLRHTAKNISDPNNSLWSMPFVLPAVELSEAKNSARGRQDLFERLRTFGVAKIVVPDSAIAAQYRVCDHVEQLYRNVTAAKKSGDETYAALHSLKCTKTNKLMGYEWRSKRQELMHFRKTHRRGGSFQKQVFNDGNNTPGPAEEVADSNLDASFDLLVGPQRQQMQRDMSEFYDVLYDLGHTALKMVLQHVVGEDKYEKLLRELLLPPEGYSKANPVSDSYYYAFRYKHTGNKKDRIAQAFGRTHVDVGLITVAPIAAVSGFDAMVPGSIIPVALGSPTDAQIGVQTWIWVNAEEIVKQQGEQEWLLFSGEVLARAVGTLSLFHRVTIQADHNVERISTPFFMRSARDAVIESAVEGHEDWLKSMDMTSFFQGLRQRVYNKEEISRYT
eukprot:m.328403 g.328403  ORF g.328403 m.328403 type:complete len:589 (+) comp20427_c0_seq13:110-1876(+)